MTGNVSRSALHGGGGLRRTGPTERFGEVVAVDAGGLDVATGPLLELVGPDGASTTVVEVASPRSHVQSAA